jgi:hypothetical protein
MLPLPLRETALPRPVAAAAARVRTSVGPDSTIASEFNVTKEDMAIVYMSQDPFFDSFEEVLDLRKWSFDKHRAAGLSLVSHNGRLYLGGMNPSTPVLKWIDGASISVGLGLSRLVRSWYPLSRMFTEPSKISMRVMHLR